MHVQAQIETPKHADADGGTDADADGEGKITIFADATNDLVKITQEVVDGTVLSQTINTAD